MNALIQDPWLHQNPIKFMDSMWMRFEWFINFSHWFERVGKHLSKRVESIFRFESWCRYNAATYNICGTQIHLFSFCGHLCAKLHFSFHLFHRLKMLNAAALSTFYKWYQYFLTSKFSETENSAHFDIDKVITISCCAQHHKKLPGLYFISQKRFGSAPHKVLNGGGSIPELRLS